MPELTGPSLAAWTTLGLGGRTDRIVVATTEEELLGSLRAADDRGTPLLILGHGSNAVVADDGFPGTTIVIRHRGVTSYSHNGKVRMTVAAGEPFDRLVRRTVVAGLSGIECMIGIPGTAGATPVQNVGAYGQEIEQVLVELRAYDRQERRIVRMSRADCGFGHRHSVLRHSARRVVLDVTLELRPDTLSRPLIYPELAAEIGVPTGTRVPLRQVPPTVLAIRRRKGMVLDPTDPDTRSAGSFFTSAVVTEPAFRAAVARIGAEPPHWRRPDGLVKLNTSWLIEHSGFTRGYGTGPVRISGKHALALTHRGGGSTAQLLALATRIRNGVRTHSGIELMPEPSLVNLQWSH